MHKKILIAIGITILFLGTCITPIVAIDKEKKASLPISNGYIQDLIDNASEGDTIYIPTGTYYENIVINKSISLVGEDEFSTIIDGNRNGDVVSIYADWVNLSEFTIKNGSSGIKINSNFNTIKGNRITENSLGTFLNFNSRNNTFKGNYLTFNQNSIKLSYSNNNSIKSNGIVTNFGDCIYLMNSYNNNIVSNSIYDNSVYKGIVLSFSDNNIIISNSISSFYDDDDCIYLSNSNNNNINDNTLSCNHEIGIHLTRSSNNIILDNVIHSEERDGICFSSSTNNIIIGNTISSDWGDGACLFSSYNNNISENSFIKSGLRIEDSYQNNVYNNTINGKPLLYFENEKDKLVNEDLGEIILINCTNVTVINQDISDSSIGIELFDTKNCNINSNNFLDCRIGIFILNSSCNNIYCNNISSKRWNAVVVTNSSTNNITSNKISSFLSGISIFYSNHNSILKNTIDSHDWGIYLGSCTENTISNNFIYASSFMYGLWIDTSSKNIISWNNIRCNMGDGLYLECNSNNNFIFNNNITLNGDNGIHFYGIGNGCENNVISENIISSNGDNGILMYKCDNNSVYHNIFFNNKQNAEDMGSNTWDDNYPSGGNYWDDYIGEDVDGDGIGDSPYYIPGSADRFPLVEPYGNLRVNTKGPYYGIINIQIQFEGFVCGGVSPYSWYWDLGDGTTSNKQNVTHSYSIKGEYPIFLSVTDDEGNKSSHTSYAWIQESNVPPDAPTIEGPSRGNTKTSNKYTFQSSDLEGLHIWYYIDWGDGSNSGWIGPYDSGIEIARSHRWSEIGTYIIRCKVKDPYDAESDWSEFEVEIPRTRASIYHWLLERFPLLHRLLPFLLL